jgi:hypothetical protein
MCQDTATQTEKELFYTKTNFSVNFTALIKREWKQIAVQRAGRALYRETVERLLQRNSELALSEPRYGGGLL